MARLPCEKSQTGSAILTSGTYRPSSPSRRARRAELISFGKVRKCGACNMSAVSSVKLCKNCQRRPVAKKRSRCPGCYRYFNRTGTERPRDLYSRETKIDQTGAPAWCDVCGDPRLHRGQKCCACYRYWIKHGKKRPRRFWDLEMGCRNCGIPLNALGHQPNGRRRQRKGYCTACYYYKNRTGEPRPRELWGIGPFGWCECGYPAVALVEDIPVCARHRE